MIDRELLPSILSLVAACVVFFGSYYYQTGSFNPFAVQEKSAIVRPEYEKDTLTITSVGDREQRFTVELALTPKQRRFGLMFKEKMPDDEGMLFIFEEIAPIDMWMKNTIIPLDMLFLNRCGVILHAAENATPHSLDRIPSRYPTYAVLELNAHTLKTHNIEIGDKVHHALLDAPECL